MKLLAVLSVFLPMSIASAMDIGISPARLNITVALGQTVVQTAKVFSTGGGTQDIAISTSDFTLSRSGAVELFPPSTLPASCAPWVAASSAGFTLDGGAQRDVRISATVPAKSALRGTYNCLVFFRVVPHRPSSQSNPLGLLQTARVGLAVYITVAGTESGGAKLQDVYQASGRSLVLSIENTGNTLMRLGGEVELRDESGDTKHILKVPDVPVLRASERDVTIKIPPSVASGYYVALALVKDSRGGVLTGQASLNVK